MEHILRNLSSEIPSLTDKHFQRAAKSMSSIFVKFELRPDKQFVLWDTEQFRPAVAVRRIWRLADRLCRQHTVTSSSRSTVGEQETEAKLKEMRREIEAEQDQFADHLVPDRGIRENKMFVTKINKQVRIYIYPSKSVKYMQNAACVLHAACMHKDH